MSHTEMSPCSAASNPGGFSREACLLWLSLLTPSTRYFEWGSGFTTRVSDGICARVTSVEGSEEWHTQMISSHAWKPTTELKYVDIGPTGLFSMPKDKSRGSSYIHAMDREEGAFDVVLVDGRFRVACAAAAYEHLAPHHAVLVHDFERLHYRPLLRIYDVVNITGTLAHLRKKSPPKSEEAARMVRSHVADPS